MGKDKRPKSVKAKYYGGKNKQGGKENEQAIKGPGIYITCPRGKEHKAVFEAYDLFNELANELYPSVEPTTPANADVPGESIEDALQAELTQLKSSSSQGGNLGGGSKRFQSRKTQTDCIAFISVAPPYDPVLLTEAAVRQLIETKIPKSKHILRLTPVSNTCYASNLGEVEALARKVLEPIFRPLGALPIDEPVTWKMQLSIRSHNTLSRMLLIPAIGGLVQHLVTEPAPASSRHSTTTAAVESVSDTTTTITQQPETGMIQRRTLKANLERPEKVVLVEILRNTCGISVVDGELYEHLGKRFNLEQIAESFFQPDAAVTHQGTESQARSAAVAHQGTESQAGDAVVTSTPMTSET